jgi:hypothetical protein
LACLIAGRKISDREVVQHPLKQPQIQSDSQKYPGYFLSNPENLWLLFYWANNKFNPDANGPNSDTIISVIRRLNN